jgi:Cu(I)/Ag(I) efflux system membrane fusion protein
MKFYKLLYILPFLLIACSSKKKQEAMTVLPADTVFYTCSMHPQVMLTKQGKCPICGMELIAVHKQLSVVVDELKLSDQQIQLANIKGDTLSKSAISEKTVLTATLNFNQMEVASINSRVMGRIEHLYVKTSGSYIHKGDKLYDLYSEDLDNAKQEYMLAWEKQQQMSAQGIDFKTLLQSAGNKLVLWGLSADQITQLQENHTKELTTAIYSSNSGYITTVDVKEGDNIMEGAALFRTASLSTLWAEAQVYASQLAHIDVKGTATVTFPDLPGKTFSGSIAFVNPEINPDTRINLIRINIPNPNQQLKPGMPAYLTISNTSRTALTLPIDAVIRTGNKSIVWIQVAPNTFKTRMVETGLETDDRIEIKSGINAGDIVIIQGVYLLNSEAIFRNGTVH